MSKMRQTTITESSLLFLTYLVTEILLRKQTKASTFFVILCRIEYIIDNLRPLLLFISLSHSLSLSLSLLTHRYKPICFVKHGYSCYSDRMVTQDTFVFLCQHCLVAFCPHINVSNVKHFSWNEVEDVIVLPNTKQIFCFLLKGSNVPKVDTDERWIYDSKNLLWHTK